MFSRLAPRVLSRASTCSKLSRSASTFLVRPSSLLSLRPSLLLPLPSTSSSSVRSYSAEGPQNDQRMTIKNIEIRILDIFRTFDKVNQDNLNLSADFTKDLGLDSLDAVEVIMAIEEEFYIEIPDAEADEIKTVQHAVDYIANCPDAGL